MTSRSHGAVFITGTSSGIGAACAHDLVAHGMHVFAGVRTQADADAWNAEGLDNLIPVMVDVTEEESIAAARETVGEMLGHEGLAGLVNNAGIGYGGPLEHFPVSQARTVFDVDFFGALATTQAFLPLLRRRQGRIVMMSSSAGRLATPFNGIYSAAKHALEGLSDALRVELSPWGIQVVLIEPGPTATAVWDKPLAFWGSSLVEDMPVDAQEDYAEAMEAMLNAVERMMHGAAPPSSVSRVVRRALTSRRPRTRYVVGRDARIGDWILRRLPDRWQDAALRRYLGLP